MAVLVLDKKKRPLMPCSEKRARLLLDRGRAVVVRVCPFIIRLKDRVGGDTQPVRIKIDPGGKTTGLALVRETNSVDVATNRVCTKATVLVLLELQHRSGEISRALNRRRFLRRRRRGQLRDRPKRFDNRTNSKEWLAPSLRHRVHTTMAWVTRLARYAPVTAISQELVRFDRKLMQSPETSDTGYQQGTLASYEVREYLLEKWERRCVYCGRPGVPLAVDQIVAEVNGGSNRVSNLTVSCHDCRQHKATNSRRLRWIRFQAKAPLNKVRAGNVVRWALLQSLTTTGLPILTATGGRTKWNRARLGIPKSYALDAVCVGTVDDVQLWKRPILTIKASGRGHYRRTKVDRNGFPTGY